MNEAVGTGLKGVGWVLDIHVGDTCANIWVKLDDGRAVRLSDGYRPNFYVESKDGLDPYDLAETMALHPSISKAVVEEKYTSILDRVKSKAVHVYVRDVADFRLVKEDIEKLDVVKEWFNIDIYHFQRYLFSKSFAPTSKVRVEWDENWKMLNVEVVDDFEEIVPPPFSSLFFDVNIQSKKLIPDICCDPVRRMVLRSGENEAETLEGSEANILATFSSRVGELDPDFLVANDCDDTLSYIFERADALSLDLQIGRMSTRGYASRSMENRVRGRAFADLDDFMEYGVSGITELSRFTLAPPTFSAKWPAGKTIDARQSFEAMRKDILVPKRRGYPRFSMTAMEINRNDKGGLLFSPVVGLHENVAELDFESMFPNIILHHNVSYETVTPNHVDKTRQGFLGEVVRTVLDRRLRFKRLRKRYPKDSQEHRWCDQRQKALKSVLVCIYGFSGCFANRFNNVAVFNEINAIARRVLVQTANLCLARGFEVLYVNTDSLFIKRHDATREDFEEVAEAIEKQTGLPIAVDHHFRFIVFMNQRTHTEIEAMNRFYGKLTNGELYYRGIELRRRDCPAFLKSFQEKLITTIFDARDREEVLERGVEEAEAFTQDIRRRIINGDVDPRELAISKHVRKEVDAYRAMLPHVVAAKHLVRNGKRLEEYSSVDFIYTNAVHNNPMRRVLPSLIMDDKHGYYDRERYAKLLLDVAHTVLKPLEAHRRSLVILDFFLP
jgi:DNA polymerase elongation subunit (family B)